MENNHDFEADNRFFLENYGTLLDLHLGKVVVIANNRVLYVAKSEREACIWSNKFGIAGLCSILEVSPETYIMLTEGVCV